MKTVVSQNNCSGDDMNLITKTSLIIFVFFYIFYKGVAVGCGWQAFVAYVNVGCYYIIGIPLGVLLGFKFDLGAKVWTLLILSYHHTSLIIFLED